MRAGGTVSGATVRAPCRCSAERISLDVRLRHRPDQRGIMGALAGDGQERPLEVDAGDARHACVDRLAHGGDRRRHAGSGRSVMKVGSRAVEPCSAMGLREQAERGRVRALVEQDAAAAIDLRVDEAGRQHAARQLDSARHRPGPATAARRPRSWRRRRDGVAVEEALAGEDPGSGRGRGGPSHRLRHLAQPARPVRDRGRARARPSRRGRRRR